MKDNPVKNFWLLYPEVLITVLQLSGTPIIQSPMDQKNLAVLTRIFQKKMHGDFYQVAKKVAVITR